MTHKDAKASTEVVTSIIFNFIPNQLERLLIQGLSILLFLLLLLICWAYLLACYNLICLSLRQLGNLFWLLELLRMIVLCLGVENCMWT